MSDIEIMGRVERRRKWRPEEKAALLAEIEAEGGRVKIVARRHQVSESLLLQLALGLEGRRFCADAGGC